MDSPTFYRLIDDALRPEFRRAGFVRQRGTVSLWTLALGDNTLFYEVAKGVKNPYIPYLGGRFNVSCDLVEGRNKRNRSMNTGISYMEYFSEGDLSAMRIIQDQVLLKIVNQQPNGEFERLMLEAHAPLLRNMIGFPFHRNAVFSLPYLDEADVLSWGSFLATRIETTVQGILTNPRFFMRPERQGEPFDEGGRHECRPSH
jgi:hypothetical protein